MDAVLMARQTAARKLPATAAEELLPVAGFKGGGPPAGRIPGLANGRVAIVMFLGAETMFFTGLLGAYLVLRRASPTWPPPDLPKLPLAVTWINTLVLAASCWTMWRANQAVRARKPRKLERHLTMTALLGCGFLIVQGSEWIRLVAHGLTMQSGVYGATFYTLIGVHGLHVLGAAIWLLVVLWQAHRNRFSAANVVAVDLVGIYWYYVGALWGVLFGMVYLA